MSGRGDDRPRPEQRSSREPRFDLSQVRLGPHRLADHSVVLRPPRFEDFSEWRRIRLGNQALIEPFWVTSRSDWDSRHSQKLWVRECLGQRRCGRLGNSLSLVIDVDGRFAGQCILSDIDTVARTGELGLWVDAEIGRHGVGGLAIAMVLDFGFDQLGLDRITAPICVDNLATAQGARKMGMVQEAVMVEYFNAGGSRKDHGLWAMLRQDAPPEGFVQRQLRGADPETTPRTRRSTELRTAVSRLRALPQAWPTLPTIGRYYASDLRSIRPGRQPDGWHRLGPAGTPPVVLRPPSDLGGTAGSDDPRHRASRLRERLPEWLRTSHEGRARGEVRLVAEVDGVVDGECGLRQVDLFHGRAEVFLAMPSTGPDGRIADSVLRLLLAYAFDQIGLRRVSAVCPTGDDSAAVMFARAGMALEGAMHDHVGPDGRRGDHDLWAIVSSTQRKPEPDQAYSSQPNSWGRHS